MSPAEMLHRILNQARLTLERFIGTCLTPRPRFRDASAPTLKLESEAWDRDYVLEKADRLCRGRFDIFAFKNVRINDRIDYHTDYRSLRSAPRRRFGPSIDYRDRGKIGDVKYIWELNRHLFMFTLARAYALTRKKKYLERFSLYLAAWLDQNPFPRGVNWASALEVSIRLLNWSLSWILLDKAVESSLRKRWLDAIFLHCYFISHHFSAYSSANNHLVGEAAGLFLASIVFPQFGQALRWRNKAFLILEREARRQIAADGVNREQAVGYAQFVLEFLFLAYAVSFQDRQRFSRVFEKRLENSCLFLAALRDGGGHVPAVGDGDDGQVMDTGQSGKGGCDSILGVAAAFFRDRGFPAFPPDDKTRILRDLRGAFPTRSVCQRPAAQAVPTFFPEGGYVILGKDFGERTEQKLVFDSGPLGFLSLAAHGHADALAFTFSFRGCPLFIDPGTLTYFGPAVWRAYFRGTAAHNTLRLDGRDQAEQRGRFMWGKKPRVKLLAHTPLLSVRAVHDGYVRPGERVLHEREVRFDPAAGMWQIIDRLLARTTHFIELFFHLAPGCRVNHQGRRVEISFPGGRCALLLPESMTVSLHHGEESPPRGWYAPAMDVRLPITTVRASKKHTGNCLLVTAFSVRGQTRRGRTTRS